MTIPSEIQTLINKLNQELDQIEQKATEGLNSVRAVLSRFPDNAIIIQFFAYLNNSLFLVETYRRRIQTTVELMSVENVTTEEIQETGEELATILGVALEIKIEVEGIITRLGG